MLQLVAENPRILTAAIRLVLVAQTPDEILAWEDITLSSESSAGCFRAVVGDHIFSVNLLSGAVLYDGLPPSRLPLPVVSDPAYKRSFGNRNFEVLNP